MRGGEGKALSHLCHKKLYICLQQQMPNHMDCSASLEVRKVSIYGINSKTKLCKKEKWTQLRMPNRTLSVGIFHLSPIIHCREQNLAFLPARTAWQSPALASLPFYKIHSSYLYSAKGGPLLANPAKQSEPEEAGHCAQGSGLAVAVNVLPVGICKHQLAPGVGTLEVLFQTAHAGLSPLDA